ncbi:MAG: hypothetical protein ACXWYM_00110 [Candidatus Binatia bacterium]
MKSLIETLETCHRKVGYVVRDYSGDKESKQLLIDIDSHIKRLKSPELVEEVDHAMTQALLENWYKDEGTAESIGAKAAIKVIVEGK